jgi:hypothetical protein
MKYCLDCRQPYEWLDKADEIYVPHFAWGSIPELILKYPDKTFIAKVENPNDDKIAIYAKNYSNIVFKTDNFSVADELKQSGARVYVSYTARSFNEINIMRDKGYEYIIVAAPVTFSVKELAQYYPNCKFRVCPNFAWECGMPASVNATFIRPEDVTHYEEGIYIFDFYSESLVQERTLYHIYAESKTWPGEINEIITNLNVYNFSNLRFPPSFGEMRANCRQACHICHYCNRVIALGKLVEKKDNN